MHLRSLLFHTTFLLLLPAPLCAQLEILQAEVPYTVAFDVAGTPHCTAALPWTDNSTIANCYTDRPTYNYSDGCANVGGLHIAGLNGETALGGRSSNSMSSFRWGVRFKNSTGVALSGIRVRVRSEQWGQAVSTAQNVVQFGHRVASTAITDVVSGTYVVNSALDLTNFSAPSGCSGGNAAVDGNAPSYSALLEACLNVTLLPGDEIMLRWSDVNDPCNDHMLCVDDLEVTGLPFPELSVDGPSQLCPGSTVVLAVTNAEEVVWSTGEEGPSITVSEPGPYTATCTTQCGSTVQLTHEVTIADEPTVAISPESAALCPGASLQLTATTNVGELLWSTGATSSTITVDTPGPYSVTTTSACGTAEVSIVISGGEAPVASITVDGGTTLCTGTSATLTAAGGNAYAWSTGVTGPILVVNEGGTWTVTVSNTCGSDQASVTLSEIDAPVVEVSASAELLCGNDEVVLTATGTGSFLWNTGATTDVITISGPGVYSVTCTNECGSASTSVTIDDGRVEASFTAAPQQGPAPLDVLVDETVDGNVSFDWDLDNGGTATTPSASATYSDPGTYVIVLTVTDPTTGCSAQATTQIVVLPGRSWVRVPNVFTPNNDGINEGLRVEHEALATLDLVIMNRWGQEVGRLKHPDDVWNGRDAGGTVADGTYYYVLNALGADGKEYAMNGSITLLR